MKIVLSTAENGLENRINRCCTIAIMGLFACSALFSTTSNSFAAKNERAEKIVVDWSKWVAKKGFSKAAIAVMHNGQLAASKGVGMEPDEPVPLASLSKAITGVCIGQLVKAGSLEYSSSIGGILPDSNSKITVAQVLTHSSGFKRDQAIETLKRLDPSKAEYMTEIAAAQLGDPTNGKPGSYKYNNGNYAIAGALISKLTGKSYEQACGELVLKPAGIANPQLNSPWRVMSSWGGWRLPLADYGRFAERYFSSRGVMGISPRKLPHVQLNAEVSYGLGYLFRRVSGGKYNYWHVGDWDWTRYGRHTEFGAFFAKWASGWTVIVFHDQRLSDRDNEKLDALLWKAAHQ